jgi:uncharacterized coiled-coil protein SlyX
MSSQVNIDVKVKTDQAASDVKKLGDDINKIKTGAPARITVDTREARTKITDIKKALSELQVGSGVSSAFGAAMGTLSQQATHLSDGLTGASKSAADMGISMGLAAANALGPWGQLVAGVAGAIGMIQNMEREQIALINTERQVQDVLLQTGLSYRTLTGTIVGATTAEQQRQALINAGRTLLNNQAALVAQGYNPEQIRIFANQINNLGASLTRTALGVTESVSVNDVLGAVVSRNTSFFRQMGMEIKFGNDQQENGIRVALAFARRQQEVTQTTRDRTQATLRQAEADLNAFIATARFRDGDFRQGVAELESRIATARSVLVGVNNQLAASNRQVADSERDLAALSEQTAAQRDSTLRERAAQSAAHSAQEIRQLREQIGMMLNQAQTLGLVSNQYGNVITPAQELESVETRRLAMESRGLSRNFEQRQQYLNLLTREVELRQNIATQEGALFAARVSRMEQERALQTQQTDALIAQENTRLEAARSQDNERRSTAKAAMDARAREAQRIADGIADGPLNNLKQAGTSFATSMSSAFMAVITGSEELGPALQKALAASLTSLATDSAAKSLFEFASGFADLAMGLPNAGLHFKAGGLFAATAVVAGAGAVAASPSGGGGTGAVAATGSSPRAEAPSRREDNEGGGAPKNISISINAFQSNEQAQALIVRSLREAGYNGRQAIPVGR